MPSYPIPLHRQIAQLEQLSYCQSLIAHIQTANSPLAAAQYLDDLAAHIGELYQWADHDLNMTNAASLRTPNTPINTQAPNIQTIAGADQ